MTPPKPSVKITRSVDSPTGSVCGGRNVDPTRDVPKTIPSSLPAKGKKRRSNLVDFLAFREPSSRALKEYEEEIKKQQNRSDRATAAGLPMVSAAKMPDHVPKVNSKWDGMPKSAKRKQKEAQKSPKSDSESTGGSGRGSAVPLTLRETRHLTGMLSPGSVSTPRRSNDGALGFFSPGRSRTRGASFNDYAISRSSSVAASSDQYSDTATTSSREVDSLHRPRCPPSSLRSVPSLSGSGLESPHALSPTTPPAHMQEPSSPLLKSNISALSSAPVSGIAALGLDTNRKPGYAR